MCCSCAQCYAHTCLEPVLTAVLRVLLRMGYHTTVFDEPAVRSLLLAFTSVVSLQCVWS